VKQVFIHAGWPKCASTYLQRAVFPTLGNYSDMAFAPRDEKYYPLRTDFDPAEFRRIVEKNIVHRDASKEHLIISCEDWVELLDREFEEVLFEFSGLDRDTHRFSNGLIAKNLKAAYPGAQILFITREPVSYAISRYKMLYRGAKTSKPITAFLERPTEGYKQAVQHYQELFGAARTHVLPFELIRTDNAEFVRQVVRLIDPSAAIPAAGEKINAAPDLRSTVEYERLKRGVRFQLEKNCRSPFARIAYVCARVWMAAIVHPKLKKQYGNESFEVTVPPAAAKNFHPSEYF
jgi:hypothetical protein